MTRIALIASFLIGFGAVTPSRAADISGVWLNNAGDAHIRLARCGEGTCGTIVWLKQPKDPKTGKAPTDEHNPDPAKRANPILGLMVAINFRPIMAEPNKFIGHFYNADDGNTYNGSITPAGANELRVEGCLAVFCQAETWTRVKR
jgi:uncharacterized protein (DUF2147 family)